MTILSREALGFALRDLLRLDYPTFVEAARTIDADPVDLRRSWCGTVKHDRISIYRMLKYCERFGYEVHFSIYRKNTNGKDHGRESVLLQSAEI